MSPRRRATPECCACAERRSDSARPGACLLLRWIRRKTCSLLSSSPWCTSVENVTRKTRSKPGTRSAAESAATESCTRRGPRDVSLITQHTSPIAPESLINAELWCLRHTHTHTHTYTAFPLNKKSCPGAQILTPNRPQRPLLVSSGNR